jgi:hypothetical protein
LPTDVPDLVRPASQLIHLPSILSAAVSPIVLLLTFAYGYGRLTERVNSLQRSLTELRDEVRWLMGRSRIIEEPRREGESPPQERS